MTRQQFIYESPVGPLYLVASEKGVAGIFWRRPKIAVLEKPNAILKHAIRELEEYFNGERREFSIPLDVDGTEFQKKVWARLTKIPYGKTCSYLDIAKEIGQPGASRAVGTANGKNPLSIVVPCHRVIASGGGLGGYAGGLPVKTRLLDLEKALSLIRS